MITRRSFITLMALAPFALQLDAKEAVAQTEEVRDVLMGTFVQMKGVGVPRQSLMETVSLMKQLEHIFSRFTPEGELATLNREGVLRRPSKEFSTVMQAARDAYVETDGAFDVSVLPVLLHFEKFHKPLSAEEQERFKRSVGFDKVELGESVCRLKNPGMKLTLDGIAKGYIIDRAAEHLRDRGCARVLVNVGGDIYCGEANNGWGVGIYDPLRDRLSRKLSLQDAAVCTSGNYVNFYSPDKKLHHIIDPRTLSSPTELTSATVVAGSTMRADMLSTALFIKGRAGRALLREGEKAYLITSDGGEVALG